MFAMALGMLIGNGDAATYLTHLEETMPGATVRERGIQLWQDMFRSSVLRVAQAANLGGGKGWVYNFNVPTDNPLGVTHASDIAFTFNAFKDPKVREASQVGFAFHDPNDPANRELAEIWSSMVASFARTGDPNGAGFPDWPTYGGENYACLIVDGAPHIKKDPDGAKLRRIFGVD